MLNTLWSKSEKWSKSENKDPYENALVEGVNGIIKTEFNLHSSELGFEQTHNQIKKSIKAHNEIWHHSSCDYLPQIKLTCNDGTCRKDGKIVIKNLTKQKELYGYNRIYLITCIAILGLDEAPLLEVFLNNRIFLTFDYAVRSLPSS